MTTKTDEQERESFEAAWASVGPPGADAESLKELRRGNGYANKHPILQGAWQGWKLARAALQSQAPDTVDALSYLKGLEAGQRAALQSQDRAEAEFELIQDDAPVAGTSGKRDQAWAEIQRYAAIYRQDGPVEIYEVTRRRIEGEGE